MSLNTIKRFGPANRRYREYLSSPEWRAKRAAVIARCNGVCERCHKYLVDEVHHLTYANVFNEPLEELRGLCKPCHRLLHDHTGIDPLVTSIQVKVSFKVIEYWDSERLRFRRVPFDTLERHRAGNPLPGLLNDDVGIYDVPIDVFLDPEGNPVFEPARWQKYKSAYRHSRGWIRKQAQGRPVPPDRETVRAEVIRVESRKAEELRRLRDSPDCFTSYQGNAPPTDKEVMALFRQNRRIVHSGREGMIRDVRATKTMGIVLDLFFDMGDKAISYKFWDARAALNDGAIVFDRIREIWVATDQKPRPEWILARVGLSTQATAC
jgi:hypothetical protein